MTTSYLGKLIVIPPELFDDMEEGLIKLRKLAMQVVPDLEKPEPWKVPEMLHTLDRIKELAYELLEKWDRPED